MIGILNPHRFTRLPFNGLVSTTGLKAWWKLGENSDGSGAVQRNDSFGVNHLADNGTIQSAPGVISGTLAADLINANTEWLSINDNNDVSVAGTELTLCGWFYLRSAGTRPIISKGTGTAAATEYVINTTSAGDVTFRVGDGTNQGTVTATAAAPSLNTWYFVCGRVDTVADMVWVRVNGGGDWTAAYTGNLVNGTSAMNIGRVVYATTNRMDGRICLVGKWDRKLSDAEVTALYNGGAGLDLN